MLSVFCGFSKNKKIRSSQWADERMMNANDVNCFLSVFEANLPGRGVKLSGDGLGVCFDLCRVSFELAI